MFRFANIECLWLLLLVPVLVVAHILYTYHKRRQLRSLGDAILVSALMPNASTIRPHVKFSITMVALTLLIFGIARPQYDKHEETIKRKGIEMVIALDISNSMYAKESANSPTRLDQAKQMLTSMINRFENDKIGVVVFAGTAFTQLPITCDYVSAKTFLQSITPSLISAQGTAIGKAIDISCKSFGESKTTSKAIILITDGETHDDDAMVAVKKAREQGIKIYVVGIGNPNGDPILLPNSNNYLKDKDGNVVITRLNEDMCREIAQAGGGIYLKADNSNIAVRTLEKELDKLSKSEIETTIYANFDEQYQTFVLIALILLAIEFFIFNRKNKLIQRINIFSQDRHE